MAEKRNPAIVCCRTASMFLIILCHTIANFTFIPGSGFLDQIFNVGVFSFLAISGYLYGGKTIHRFSDWFRNRYFSVMLPATALTIFVLIAELCMGNRYSVFSILIHLLNLQGLGFLYPRIYSFFSEIPVLGPLWFISVIMLCYCLVPALQKIRGRCLAWRNMSLYITGVVIVGFAFTMLTGFNIIYFLTFSVGYYLSAKDRLKPIRISGFLLLSVLMFAAQIFRLVLRNKYDGLPLYQNYSLLSHMSLGIWILCFFFLVNQLFPNFTDRIAGSKIMIALNDISFYVYLTHYFFCSGLLNAYRLTDNLLVNTAVFSLATLASAVVLKKVAKFLQHTLSSFFTVSHS